MRRPLDIGRVWKQGGLETGTATILVAGDRWAKFKRKHGIFYFGCPDNRLSPASVIL